ncbi:MAG: hypothetical protein NTY74_15770 [Ignavibacteriae bacterium]|nr:hypothetical protein [Ignavibacteriota bacterium]
MLVEFFNSRKNKLVLAVVLFVVMIVLAFFYRMSLVKDKALIKEFSTNEVKILSSDELKKILPVKIDSIASLFGIKKEWISDVNKVEVAKPVKGKTGKKTELKTDKKTKPVVNDALWFAKNIQIPKDVSTAEVNLEIKSSLFEYDFDCTANEDPKSGNLMINIFNKKDSSNKTLAYVNLEFSDKIKRDAADVCLILNNVENIPLPQLEKMLLLPDKFSVVLPDMVSRIDAQTVVMDTKRDYVLFLDIGTEDDLLSEFKKEMSPKELRSKVRSTCYEYDKASAVIILNPKKIHPMETDLLMEFSKYNLKAYKDTILIKFASEEKSGKKVNIFFSDIQNRSQKGAKSMVYLVDFNNDDINYFRNESYKLKRKGFKFYNFTEIMKKRAKSPEPEIKPEITG